MHFPDTTSSRNVFGNNGDGDDELLRGQDLRSHMSSEAQDSQ